MIPAPAYNALSLPRRGATPRPVSLLDSPQFPLDILGIGLSAPETTVAASDVLDGEAARVSEQLGALSEPFRARVLANLGIEAVMREQIASSREFARRAAVQALEQAELGGDALGLIVDFTTYAVDAPGIWSLGQDIQHFVQASDAVVVGAQGSGCCGLHLALRVAQAFLAANSELHWALLVASDRAPEGGRVCLPISIMADAASAVVVARAGHNSRRIGRVSAVMTQSSGRFADVLSAEHRPPRIVIDSAAFERHILPLHFVILNRVLTRALEAANLAASAIDALVYPNTTDLDRLSVVRALNFDLACLVGPGPRNHGHAFANDLIINAQALFSRAEPAPPLHTAWLAAGSGFTWGAAIIDVG